jgi:CheY-like chemotaxis protein
MQLESVSNSLLPDVDDCACYFSVCMAVILVVDDYKDLLPSLSDALTTEGWRVLAAPSASAALRTARSIGVDVVLTDLLMPDQDGQSLENAFRNEAVLKDIPFVFMTGAVRQVREMRASRVLVKPFTIAEAVAMLKSCVLSDEREWVD